MSGSLSRRTASERLPRRVASCSEETVRLLLVPSVPWPVLVLPHQAHDLAGRRAAGPVHFGPAVLQCGRATQEGPGALGGTSAEPAARGQLPALPGGTGPQPATPLHTTGAREENRRCRRCGRCGPHVPRGRRRLAHQGRAADVEAFAQ